MHKENMFCLYNLKQWTNLTFNACLSQKTTISNFLNLQLSHLNIILHFFILYHLKMIIWGFGLFRYFKDVLLEVGDVKD